MKMQLPVKHVIVAVVDNNPGVVSRIAGLFTRRGYNIESLVTGVTENPEVYRLILSVISTEEELTLMLRQLGRIAEVIEVYSAAQRECVTRELMFIKIKCSVDAKADIIQTANAMRYEIAGVGSNCVIVQVTGDDARLDSAVRAFEHSGIIEIIRSGAVTIDL